ncbi:MAG: T9SS type A sorting domain-containing protein [Flavobacteriales bacterium]|nr:T9SS type A sorting domain-containing protein [Flavobacteriales bacterium]
MKGLVLLFFFFLGNVLFSQNWNYTYPTGLDKSSISGIVPIGDNGEYIIQSTDGTVSKIDASGDIVWTLNEREFSFPPDDMMQESIAVIGKHILAINGFYWKLIFDFGGSASVLKKAGWKIPGCYNDDDRVCQYKGVPVRVKAIHGDFIICGGLHRVAPAGNSVGGVYLDFLTRVNTAGAVLWQKTYNAMSSGPGGDMGAGINLITDVEAWQEDKLVFVKSTSLLYANNPGGGSVSIVNFSDGSVNSHSYLEAQVDPSDPSSLRSFNSEGGFWDIEVDKNKARMIGYIKHTGVANEPRRALFCTYSLTTNTILDLKMWEVPGKEIFLSKMQKIGGSIFAESPEYVVSATIYEESANGFTNDHVIISCDASGSIFNSAYSVDNTKIERNSPSQYPKSSTFYTNTGYLMQSGGVFLLGSKTADTELPLVKKSASLSSLGCKTDIQINSVPWAGEVLYTWVGYPQSIAEITKTEILSSGATKLIECCLDGVYSFGGPDVSIDGELDLCISNPTVLTALVGIYPDPVNFLWSPGGEITSSITVTEPGTYTVTVGSTTNPSCGTTISVEVTGEKWHKTTENTTGSEVANDVVTDVNGNVYMVGTFTNTTELEGGANPNITIIGGAGNPSDMYVAKYDNCGTLLWVANTVALTGLCTGNSLVLDELNQMVYVTGNVSSSSSITFNSSQSAGMLCLLGTTEMLIPTLSTSGYVAQYDMGTGCLYFAEEVSIGTSTDCRTLTVNETNGKIYLGGSFTTPSGGASYYSFIYKYTPTTAYGVLNILDVPSWTIYDNVQVNLTYNVVNDLDFDETENRLYIIGNFKKVVNLYDGIYTASVSKLGLLPGAFMAAYDDPGSPSYVTLRGGNGSIMGSMTGEGIAVDESTNNIFLTGSFEEDVTTAFSVTGIDPLITFNSNSHSYMLSFNLTDATHRWAHQTHATTGANDFVIGKDVTTINGNAVFLNEFSGTHMIVDVDGFFEALPFIGSSAGNTHLGIISFTNTGVKNWMNVTESQSPTGSDHHRGNAICSDLNQHSFVVGAYDNKLSYQDGSPYSGNLSQTGSGDNAFVMRVQNASGAMHRQKQEESITINSATTTSLSVNIYPNPTADEFNLLIEYFNSNDASSYQVRIYNLLGEQVFSTDLKEANTKISLDGFSQGIYLLNLTKGSESFHHKIIKQ